MRKIVIFASGSGSNAEKIILHFKNSILGNVVGVFTNNPHAKVIQHAQNHQISFQIFTKEELFSTKILDDLIEMQPDVIVLAGFLLKFPEFIIKQFPNKIINIHPALLPKYGGKGMYGKYVHQAVLENKEKESGITIHYVNEHYDEGAIIAQYSVNIEECVDAGSIADKVQELEHQFFSIEIERLITHNL